ncbi:hypothetical protein ACI3LY_000066 [Candidozyma auris]|uniref:2-dehydropantoate 2-reductase n=2 Tax=Candidozyma auris TaxID=498019 RepID=A0A2H1A6I2_CANAR|nr:hypothetical_protein [[Candida] auris]KNE00060.2 hypothetical protein QG37_03007 [[Candida] auris]PIS58490.1 hypothetical protein B9J08_000989 [[Candida] auris]QEO20562.1 hypothetical_protein [[Candida] auris]
MDSDILNTSRSPELQFSKYFSLSLLLFSKKMPSKVVVVGSGGVGSMAAYALSLNAETTAIVRSDYNQVSKHGFSIESVDYGTIESFMPQHVVPSIGEAAKQGPYDFIVVTTKNTPDISKGEELIEPLVGAESTIVLVQNGIDIGAPYVAKYPQNVVLSGVSMISSTNYGGKITHVGHDELMVGYFTNPNLPVEPQESAAKSFVRLYKNAHNDCVYDENVKYTRWRKLVYNATLNTICSLTGVDVGRLELFGGMDMVRTAMREVLAAAKSDGVDLPESIMEFMIRSDDGNYYAPSMLVDIRKGNYIELEVILGNAVRIAERNGVAVPTLSLVYKLLAVVQKSTMEAKGAIDVPKERPVPSKNGSTNGI